MASRLNKQLEYLSIFDHFCLSKSIALSCHLKKRLPSAVLGQVTISTWIVIQSRMVTASVRDNLLLALCMYLCYGVLRCTCAKETARQTMEGTAPASLPGCGPYKHIEP